MKQFPTPPLQKLGMNPNPTLRKNISIKKNIVEIYNYILLSEWPILKISLNIFSHWVITTLIIFEIWIDFFWGSSGIWILNPLGLCPHVIWIQNTLPLSKDMFIFYLWIVGYLLKFYNNWIFQEIFENNEKKQLKFYWN